MLRLRLLAAATILIPLAGILYADVRWNAGAPGIWLVPVGWLVSLLAASELLDLVRTPGRRLLAWPVYVGGSLVFLSSCVPVLWPLFGAPYPDDCPVGRLGWPLLATMAAFATVLAGEMQRYEKPGGTTVQAALAFFTIVYAAVPLSFAMALRQLHGNRGGMAALLSVIFIVKLSDTGAYFVGKRFGRRKLAPRLSPGKTIAGGIGCLGFAIGAAILFLHGIAPWMTGEPARGSWWGAALYGALLAVAGLAGDLAESLLKRDMERKDSSSWLPGLGGILDILDSLQLAFPVAYLCWAAGL